MANDMNELLGDLVDTSNEVLNRHEEAGAVVHRSDPNLHMDILGSIAGTPQGFFFELLIQALRALREGNIEKAADRVKGALGVADRHDEVDETNQIVPGVVAILRDLESGDTEAIFNAEAELGQMEDVLRDTFGQ